MTQTICTPRKLKDFNEYWEEKYERGLEKGEQLTGISCPDCGTELVADYTIVLTSNPPKYHAWCPNRDCGWKGYV